MKSLRWMVLFVAVLATASSFGADAKYTLKLKEGEKGATMVERTSNDVTVARTTDAAGTELLKIEKKGSKRFVYRQTVLDKKANEKKPSKIERTYEKAVITKDGQTENLPLAGKTVLIEKQGNAFVFQFKGGNKLSDAEAENLELEFNKNKDGFDNDLLLPKKAVDVNESWNLDKNVFVKVIEKLSQAEVDAARVKCTGKLVKAYQKDGKSFGVMEFDLRFPLKALIVEKQRIAANEGSAVTMKLTLDACIDGTSENGEIKTDFAVNCRSQVQSPDGSFGTIVITMKMDEKIKVTESAKK